ncbi:MAG: hypothetical protein ACU0B7_07630 [Paracoccaceae bacterium]
MSIGVGNDIRHNPFVKISTPRQARHGFRSYEMSHSENNLDRQKKRHKGPLIGIAVVIVFAVVAIFILGAADVDDVNPSALTPAQSD